MYFKRPMCALCLCFVFLFWLYARLFPPWEAAERFSEGISSEKVLVCGRLSKLEHKNFSTILYLKNISLKQNQPSDERVLSTEGLIAYLSDPGEEEKLHIGCTLVLTGEYSLLDEAVNTGNFDARKYYAVRRIYGRVKKAKIQSVSREYSAVEDALFRLKEKTRQVFFYYLSETEAGTLTALILGDKTALDEEVKESYQNAGIAHILSLSGLHIAALGLLLLKLFKRTGLPVWASSLCSGLLMLLYSMMTGLSTSTVRALIMFLLGVIAQCLKRTYDLLSGAAFSAILILFENPAYIFDSGFLLSFFAVMGIGLLYPLLLSVFKELARSRCFDSLHNSEKLAVKFVKNIGLSLLFSLSIQLATLPVTEYSFFQIPLYGIFLNLLVIPLMTGVLGAGVLLSIAGNLALTGSETNILHPIFNLISTISSTIASVILRLYSFLTGTTGSLAGNLWICGRPLEEQIVLYGILFLVLIGLYSFFEGKRKKAELSEDMEAERKLEVHYRRYCLTAPVIIGLAVFLLSFRRPAPLELHAISVGQGDCMLVYGRDTPVILVDGGATDIKNTGKYRIAPCLKAHGISVLDYVFISHFDADHVNGIIELLSDVDNGITIRRIIISSVVPLMEPNANFDALKEAAADNRRLSPEGVPVMMMDAGDIIEAGELVIDCLGPDVSGSAAWRGRDLNDNSLILYLRYKKNGFSALFTGDMSKETERELLERYRDGTAYLNPLSAPVTLLKAAHHGSKSAGSEEFIRLLSPMVTTISCGKDNSYGHPHKEALKVLQGISGNRIYLTPRDGEITLRVEKNRMSIETFLNDTE